LIDAKTVAFIAMEADRPSESLLSSIGSLSKNEKDAKDVNPRKKRSSSFHDAAFRYSFRSKEPNLRQGRYRKSQAFSLKKGR
jgi:hypothetical protein